MKKEGDDAMATGAWGIFLGMDYMPCTFSCRDEFARVLKRVAKHDGFWLAHGGFAAAPSLPLGGE